MATRVLYVETGEVERAVSAVEDDEVTLVAAEDGVDALKRLDGDQFDVVVVPDELPGIDLGWFCRRAQTLGSGVSIIVIGDPTDVPSDVAVVDRGDGPAAFSRRFGELVADRTLDSALDNQDRLEGVAFDVSREAVVAENDETILEACFDRLVEEDLFEFVWVGRYDHNSETVTLTQPFPMQVSPAEIAESLGISASGFVQEAVESSSVTIAEGTAPSRSAGVTGGGTAKSPVRRDGLRYATVPFSDDGETYGFALLGANRTDAFDATEQAVLADLGRIVGRSLAWVEARRPRGRSDLARIDQFVDIFAHELRNPLTIAQSYLEIGREDQDDEALDRVGDALEAIEEIIDAVTTMAGAGGIEDAEAVEVTSRAAAVWRDVRAESAALTIEEPFTVDTDSTLLDRLLSNLFRNAIDHGGPAVTIRVGALPSEEGFYVEDDGPGISKEDRETVFEWGYSTDSDHLGVGLGFVREIVEAHDWEISVGESSDGGARFEIRTDQSAN